MVDHVDYSQYAKWCFCPWAWFEASVLRRRKCWPKGLRADALAIESLVHAGSENHYANNSQEIPEEVIAKIGPTPEALGLCRRLIYGYVNHFPREQWELIRCERPLRFNLIDGKEGLAKLDLYFYLSKPTVVESGIAGYEITLKPGWWIQEYKTKSAATSTADFMHEWTTKMQADFQMLALQEYISKNTDKSELNHTPYWGQVNGLLVNVIEKPREYVPKRKCPNCKTTWNFSAWQPGEGGKHACPQCGQQKKLDPVESERFQEPSYFRMVVERTPEQLKEAQKDIFKVAQRMKKMEAGCKPSEDYIQLSPGDFEPPNKEHCFDNSRRWGKECDYYQPHTYGFSTIGSEKYEEAEDYLNETIAPA